MKKLSVISAIVAICACSALADWDVGDYHKMHYPQLPNMTGWDVHATYYEGLADDWQCSESGPVTDLHWWGSWLGDVVDEIEFFHISIWSDDPVGNQNVPGEDTANQWSKPLERLWHQDFYPTDFTSRYWGQGLQGWYDPGNEEVIYENHDDVYQYNINFIDNPFYQTEGEIYWLEISAKLPFGTSATWGWKSSIDHFNDDAVWAHSLPNNVWAGELYEPGTTQSLDLAFVITPEPTTVMILGLGALLIRRKK